ncbi:43kDa postsynaptic protein [Parasponia andersonii]|uniref:43kDa postsynaptic protein n=1 Tax=Parasponia andersonii TaxID=3476 RepID=A0A2P5DWW6_PARAD|nr:43kDa postsynaptic protein [Parasponia andersonii]
MANDDLKNEYKPPGSTPVPQGNDLGFTLRRESARPFPILDTAGADNMSIPSTQMPLSSTFPYRGMQVMPQLHSEERPSTNFQTRTDSSRFRNSQPPKYEHEFLRRKDNNVPIQHRPYSSPPCREGDITPYHHFHSIDSPVAPDNVRNHASNVLWNQNINKRFVPVRDNSSLCLPMSGMLGDISSSDLRMPQPITSFARPEGRTPTLWHSSDGEDLEIGNNLMASVVQPYCSQKPDGSFLTLGIGDAVEDMSKCNISGGNISSNNNPSINFTQSYTSDHQSARSSGLQNSVDGWTFPSNDPSGVNLELFSDPYYIAETTQGDENHQLFVANNFAPGIAGNKDARFAGIKANYDYQGHSAISSIPGSNQVGLPDSRRSKETGLPLASNLRTPTQPAIGQSQNMKISRNSLSEPSMVSPINTGIVVANASLQDWDGGFCDPQISGPQRSSRTLVEVTTGQEIPVTNVNRISQTSSVSTRPCLKRGATQSSQATSCSQRRRKRTSFVSLSIPNPIQNASRPPNLSETGSHMVQAHTALSLPHRVNNNTSYPHLTHSAQLLSLPPQPYTSPLPPQLWTTSIPPQFLTASQFVSLPRTAPPFHPRPLTSLPLIPRSRTTPTLRPRAAPPFLSQPRTAPPFPLQPQKAPGRSPQFQKASPRPSQLRNAPPLQQKPPTTSFHIKWQGFEQTSQTIGHKCFLCNRDLSFTPNGPVFQPSPPPPTAVLPCGHVFHDHCLQLITPHVQAKDPPCIPCAVGES